jgi:hypothetical protein
MVLDGMGGVWTRRPGTRRRCAGWRSSTKRSSRRGSDSTWHGAPLRLRVENQLGFKQVKWIREIEFVRHFSERGESQGGYNEDHEFYGYRDEI